MDENERRRATAHDMWLQQLTPEQRAELAAEPEEGFGLLWVPDEPRESLQRAIERRD